MIQLTKVNLITSLVMITMIIICLGSFVSVNDYNVYSMDPAEIDKLFQNLTPDHLGTNDFSINGELDLVHNTNNLSNLS